MIFCCDFGKTFHQYDYRCLLHMSENGRLIAVQAVTQEFLLLPPKANTSRNTMTCVNFIQNSFELSCCFFCFVFIHQVLHVSTVSPVTERPHKNITSNETFFIFYDYVKNNLDMFRPVAVSKFLAGIKKGFLI